ncbi:MAG: TonB-dependent receptor [Acidobacteriaceae bacterium]|nr:TonB-dependent receptor [Acidobacteriaceae bacterium]
MAAALLLGLGSSASAQQVFGSIIGTVTDPSGSAVNNAKVTITDVTKGTSFEVTTNDSGQYTKGQLIPDQYTVTIEASGFQKVVSNQVTVQVDQATQFNAALQVGNVNQEVEVTAAAPLLQTDRADVAQTFTSQEISQLPSIGRNLQAFELLNPGTIKTPWAHASDEDPQGSVQSAVNGLPFYMTGYYLDGTVNQDPILGIIVVNPTFDSVNEVKQANQDYDAEFDSFAAGLFTYSTKSGTNSFHGDAFEYLEVNTPGFQDFGRNPFTENTPLAGSTDAYTPTTHQNQYGGSIGGRIIKDKLFFFGDAQLTRKQLGGSALVSVPTAQDRTGNLSDWLALGSQYQVYCPSNAGANANKAVPGNILNTGFCGNAPGTTSALSPQAQALLSYFPLPNTGAGLPYNNYENSGTLTVDGNQWNTRFDYYGNEKNTFFGRYSYAGFTEQAPGVFGALAGGIDFNNANYAGSSQALNQSASAGWTYTKSPTTINEFRWGYVRYHVTDVPNGYGSTPASQAGIPGLNTSAITSGMPTFAIQNPLGAEEDLGYSLHNNQCNCPLTEFERQYQFVDNISHIAGKHSFKFGGDVRYAENLRVPSDSHRAGELYFTDATTGLESGINSTNGLALATFLLGDVSSFNRYVSSSTDAEERQKRLFWYAQDEWRPTSKLTITYGVRWEMIFPETVNAPGNGAELNVNTGLVDVFGEGLISSHGYQSMNWHEFAPRLGIAYQLTPKTVIRTGYGWTYSLGTFGSTFGHNVTQNPPVLVNQTLTATSNTTGSCSNANFCDVFTLAQGPPAQQLQQPNPNGTFAPATTGVYIKTRPGIFTMPVAYAYNFTIQHQVGAKVSLQGSYVGNSTRHSSLGTGNDYDENPEFFLPGYTGDPNLLRPFDGLYGPRYNYGWAEGVDCYCNDANSQYNSFQGVFTVKNLAGYTLQGNYTWQSEQGDGYGPDSNYTFLYDRPLGYGNSNLVPHQQWTLANVYDVPFGKGRHFGSNANRFVDAVLGGWQVSGIFTYYSGVPFMPNIGSYPGCTNLTASTCPAGDSTGQPYTGPNSVPDVGSGSPYSTVQNRYTWIVTETPAQLIAGTGPFKLPAANTFGNYPVNTLYGPQFVNLDASLMKVFSFTERFKFQLRMDATNALNHTNLATPSNNVTGGNAEQITNIAFNGNGYAMRRVQFSGTLSW